MHHLSWHNTLSMHLCQYTVFTKSLNSILQWSLSEEEAKLLNFPSGLYLFWQKLCRGRCTKAGLATIKMIPSLTVQFSVLPARSGRALQNWMLTDFIWAVEATLLEFKEFKGHRDLMSLHHHYWNKKRLCILLHENRALSKTLLIAVALCLTLLEHLLLPKRSWILQVFWQATPAQWPIWHSLGFRCQPGSSRPLARTE